MFQIITIILFIVFAAVGFYHRIQAHRAGDAVSRRGEGVPIMVLLRVFGFAMWLGLFLYMIHPPWMAWAAVPLPAWLRWTGAGLVAVSIPLIYWMFSSLGRNVTDTVALRAQHQLITHGPYRWIRHPMYTFSVPAFVGFSLLSANVFIGLTGLVALGILVARTPIEEAALAAHFGPAYDAYRQRTGRFLPRIFAVLLLCWAGCASDPATEVDAHFAAYTGADTPGAAVLVIKDGVPVVRKGYGMADLETRTPVTPQTNFRLASVTKQFTAMGILQLVDQGRLHLDDPVHEIIPDLPEAVTLRHLLQHTAGLIDYEALLPDTATVQVLDQDVLALMQATDSTYFAPGTQYRYSNSGYAVLAMVIEAVSGLSFPEFLKQHIFDPLEMHNSVAFQAGQSTVPHRAFGYTVEGDSTWFSDQSVTSAVLGDGGIYSSLDDLYQWDQALYTHRLVSYSLLQQAFTPGLEGYGFGWRIGTYNGHRRTMHTGSTRGFRTVYQRYPDAKVSVIILTNRNGPAVADLADQLADLYLPPAGDALEHSTLFTADSLYTAWPAIARAGTGELVVLYTQTDEHMGPDGRIVGVRSSDEGRTWSAPFPVYDTPLDERESGLTVLDDGTLLAHFWSTQHTPASYGRMAPGSYHAGTVSRWTAHVDRPAYRNATAQAGARVAISTDAGRTWSPTAKGPDTIHGGIQLQDGTLLTAAYRQSRNYVTIHKAPAWDGPWTETAAVHSPQPDSLRFGEPSVVQLPSGRVLLMMRTTTIPYNDADPRCFLWETYSDDGGLTWVPPFQTPLWGFPPHLLLLEDGRVLVTYGHRRPPYGQRAALSTDGITWQKDQEIVLRADAPNKDLGYPASVQLRDGRVLTVYYQAHPTDTLRPPEGPPPDRHKPDILATRWTPPPSTP